MMRAKSTVSFSVPRWLRLVLLVSLWILSGLILAVISANNGLEIPSGDTVNFNAGRTLPRNKTGSITYSRWNPRENCRPICYISLKNLLSENNRIGIFKTALHRLIRIADFEVEFHRYSSSEVTSATKPNIPVAPKEAAYDATALIKNLLDRLTDPKNSFRIESIDLSNVSKVQIHNFGYRVLDDGKLLFAVQAKKTTASYGRPDVMLRGHVTITAADGGILECNRAKWNVKAEQFKIDGVYVLNHNGIRTTGKGICVDTQLYPVGSSGMELKREEENRCFGKLP